jgi:hypothetical protein
MLVIYAIYIEENVRSYIWFHVQCFPSLRCDLNNFFLNYVLIVASGIAITPFVLGSLRRYSFLHLTFVHTEQFLNSLS